MNRRHFSSLSSTHTHTHPASFQPDKTDAQRPRHPVGLWPARFILGDTKTLWDTSYFTFLQPSSPGRHHLISDAARGRRRDIFKQIFGDLKKLNWAFLFQNCCTLMIRSGNNKQFCFACFLSLKECSIQFSECEAKRGISREFFIAFSDNVDLIVYCYR